jgi:urease accessory protein
MIMPAAAALHSTFAANRAAGRLALEVGSQGGITRRVRVYEDGPLRVRFPHADAQQLEAVVVNTGGGIAGGDCHDIELKLREDARLMVTTAAAEKVYRALGPDAKIEVRLDLAAGARLSWLPQETILFDRARLQRRIEVDVAEGAALLMAEAVVFGRSAMNETVAEGSFTDRWRVRRGGRLLFAETIRLDGAIAERLAEPAVASGGAAMATVLAVPGDDAMIARVRAHTDFCGEVGVSAWNGLAVARLCAKDGQSLRRDLTGVLKALGAPLPRLWLQ